MKQLLVLSGKGGTGKTTVATGLIYLSEAKAYADCDVDAPNLHLLMKPTVQMDHKDFFGMKQAVINQSLCTDCGLCEKHCRFNAILKSDALQVDPFACEGCGVCQGLCPANAISLLPSKAGDLMLYKGKAVFSTAELKMGRGTSGMLVSEVKKRLIKHGIYDGIAIIDGSPGIGCPVIASISGVDMVLIVAEPSLSGISDMKRIIETTQKFQTPVAICVNKYDTNVRLTEDIILYSQERQIPFVGKIPYDQEAVTAINNGVSIVQVPSKAGDALRIIYKETLALMGKRDATTVLFPIK